MAEQSFRTEDTMSGHVLDRLILAHERQRRLCRKLEEIADALPGPVDRELRAAALPNLRTDIASHSAILEGVLFPLLRRRARVDDDIEAIIRRVLRDNAADDLLAQDSADQLEAIEPNGKPDNPNMLAYMLRGLFEGRRRHIAWERLVLIPLARSRLRADDLKPIDDVDITASRRTETR